MRIYNISFSFLILASFFSAISIAVISVGASLYFSALQVNQKNLTYISETTARLISATADFDRQYSDNDGFSDVAEATLSQIRAAFDGNYGFGETGEIVLAVRDDDDIRVLVHQTIQNTEHEHPALISPGDPFYAVFAQAFSGRSGYYETDDFWGHDILIAHTPIAGTDWVIIIEKHLSELRAPFIKAGILGALITLLVSLIGGVFNYRVSKHISVKARKAEQASKEALSLSEGSQKQLNAALNVMNEGFALFDKDDRLVICNDVYKDFYSSHAFAIKPGNTFEEILRAGLSSGAFSEAVGREEDWIKERLVQHQKTETVTQQLSDGRWLQISETRTSDGGIVGVRTDITSLVDREMKLIDSEKRYKDFTKTASDWTWETDAEHRFSVSNRGKTDDLQFDEDAIIMQHRQDVAVEDTTTDKWRNHQSDLDGHRPFTDFRYWTIAPNKTKRLISVSGVPVFDQAGLFLGYRGTGKDITDQYEASKNLEAAEERLRLAFENLTIGVVLSDEKGFILAFNNAAETMFGYTCEEVLGKNVSMLASEEYSQHHDNYIENYHETREAKIIGIGREVMGRRKDGKIFPLNLGIAEMKIGGKTQYIASLLDLTEEKLLEQKLQQSQKMELVGQLVGGIAHDFNNLLGIIIGNLDLMRRKIEPESRLAKQVGKALKAAERGANLTRRLLNFSRQMPTDVYAVDVNATITDLHELIQKSLTERVSVDLQLGNELPLVNAEPGDLEDVLTNLCINARDAMPNGGRIIIETRLTDIEPGQRSDLRDLEPGQYVELDISDTGTGMPPEIASRIFEPFFSTKEKGKGTGLGLAMVYGFAKRSGGMITVYSEEGLGTTFKLFLPVAENIVTLTGSVDIDVGADYSGNEQVLIVDDEEDLAEIAESILSELGYQTLVAHSGYDALEIIQSENKIDLLLTDIIMPGGMDGVELAQLARESCPSIRVCLASGFTGATLTDKKVGMAEFPLLKKPYTNSELAQLVRKTLDLV